MKTSYLMALPLVAATSLLTACAPNPTVLQDRVYDRYPQRPQTDFPSVPRYEMPSHNVSTASTHDVTQPRVYVPRVTTPKFDMPSPTVSYPLPKEPTLQVESLPIPKAKPTESAQPIEEEPVKMDEPKRAPRAYKTSSAVKTLLAQADGEASQGKVDAAIATVERALRIESDNPALWLKLSDLNKRQGNIQQASSMADKARYYQEMLN